MGIMQMEWRLFSRILEMKSLVLLLAMVTLASPSILLWSLTRIKNTGEIQNDPSRFQEEWRVEWYDRP